MRVTYNKDAKSAKFWVGVVTLKMRVIYNEIMLQSLGVSTLQIRVTYNISNIILLERLV